MATIKTCSFSTRGPQTTLQSTLPAPHFHLIVTIDSFAFSRINLILRKWLWQWAKSKHLSHMFMYTHTGAHMSR